MEKQRISPAWWLVVFLGFGAALALSLELLFETWDLTPSGLDPHRKDYLEGQTLKSLERLKGPIGRFWVEQGRLPRDFEEMMEYRAIEPRDIIDPFWHKVRWEEDASGSRLRSAGWDRVFRTKDDITLDIYVK